MLPKMTGVDAFVMGQNWLRIRYPFMTFYPAESRLLCGFVDTSRIVECCGSKSIDTDDRECPVHRYCIHYVVHHSTRCGVGKPDNCVCAQRDAAN